VVAPSQCANSTECNRKILTPTPRPTLRIGEGRRSGACATVSLHMATLPPDPAIEPGASPLYCPNCAQPVNDPLTCGDCSAVICRRCGTPLESADELGMG